MHANNLVAQQAIESSDIIQDAASLTNGVAASCNRSTKLTKILYSIQALKHDRASLRPFAQLVLVRGAALKTVLDQHESVDQALSKYAEASSGENASKSRGLLKQITVGEFVLGIMMSHNPAINLLESLNKAVQSRSIAITGAVASMEVTYKRLEGLRTEDAFHEIFASCIICCEELGVETSKLPRVSNRSKRYEVGSSANHQ